MDRVLGIDGGGTKTDVALVDRSGRVLSRMRTEGLDPTGESDWEAVLGALAADLGPVGSVVLGLPYHGEIAEVSDRQAVVAARVFGPGAQVLNDVKVAFDGVLILAGTGSMAWARGPLGMHRVGGWGDLFGDEGSAFWIGREALPAYVGAREHGFFPAPARGGQGRDRPRRDRGGRDSGPDALPRPPAQGLVRRAAAAGGDGAGHRAETGGVPVRRTAVEPGRRPSCPDARRNPQPARPARLDLDLRDA